MAKSFSQISLVRELLMGFWLGTANIIPGVSGGTFLLIFGIYERVFESVSHINAVNAVYVVKVIFRFFFKPDRQCTFDELTSFLIRKDFIFLFKLAFGSVIAIICLSSLMKFLITSCFSVTYAFFFGLIFVSIVIPVKMLTERKASLFFWMALGAALTIYVTWAVNPYDKVARKSAIYQQQYEHTGTAEESSPASVSVTVFNQGRYDLRDYGYAFLCGSVAVSAMVLPGISGSLVLILMGEYFEVVSAISGLTGFKLDSVIFLAVFAIGILFGGLVFARAISAVLKRYYNETMAFLIGLMVGSLWALWPFKQAVIMARQYVKNENGISFLENVRVYTNINIFPGIGVELGYAILFFIIGCVIMSIFVKKEKQA